MKLPFSHALLPITLAVVGGALILATLHYVDTTLPDTVRQAKPCATLRPAPSSTAEAARCQLPVASSTTGTKH